MAVMTNKDNAELIVTCNCGCDDAMHIRIDVKDDDICILSYMNSNFYRDQYGTIGIFFKKLKKILAIIRNRDYYYSDVIMKREEFEEFKRFINGVDVE